MEAGRARGFVRPGRRTRQLPLPARIARAREASLDVVNLSRATLDLPDELELLRRFGGRYEPDVVLHGMFVGNDFSVRAGRLMDYGGIQVRARSDRAMFRPRCFTLGTWIEHLLRFHAEAWRKRASGIETMFTRDTFIEIEASRLRVVERGASAGWRPIEHWLDEIRTHTEELGARYVMVIHPDQFQVETPLREALFARTGWNPDGYDFDAPPALPARLL